MSGEPSNQDYSTDMTQRKALFLGTFDPFTIGHASIARRALAMFDRLVIGVYKNDEKHPVATVSDRVQAIKTLYAADNRVEVKPYSDLAIDFARREGACCIVKGVRSVRDFEYEREQADVNRQLGGIETLLLVAEPELASVSSTLVRVLRQNGKDVTALLPQVTRQQ